MADTVTRVGVVSDNATMVVALSLQAPGFEIIRVARDQDVDAFDVVVLDAGRDDDPLDLVASVADELPIVLITEQDRTVPAHPRLTVLTRPYTVRDLIAAMTDARDRTAAPALFPPTADDGPDRSEAPEVSGGPAPAAGDVVELAAVADEIAMNDQVATDVQRDVALRPKRGLFVARAGEGASETTTPPPDSSSAPRRRRVVGEGAPPTPTASTVTMPVPEPRIEDPIEGIERTARLLSQLLRDAPFLRTARRFADGIAATLQAEFEAATVILWQTSGERLEVFGASAVSNIERGVSLHVRHPLFEQAAATNGVLLENANHGDALTLGVPGVRAAFLAVVQVPTSADHDLAFIQLSADQLDASSIERVESFVHETGTGWAAAAAVERLARDLMG